mgnify:CR=1 FL=1
MFLSILTLLFTMFFPFLVPIFIIFVTIIYLFFYEFFINKNRLIKKDSRFKEVSFFRKIFVEFPKQFVKDVFEKNPNKFNQHQITFFCGPQGTGKTLALVEYLQRQKYKYPNLQIYTNFNVSFEDGKLLNGEDMIYKSNGEDGVVFALDEIHTWYSSSHSRNFPPSLLSEISYQRKQRKQIVATSQNFSRIAKPLREQCDVVVLPKTILSCITICRVYDARSYSESTGKFKDKLYSYFFIHSDELRQSYDTYAKIQEMQF